MNSDSASKDERQGGAEHGATMTDVPSVIALKKNDSELSVFLTRDHFVRHGPGRFPAGAWDLFDEDGRPVTVKRNGAGFQFVPGENPASVEHLVTRIKNVVGETRPRARSKDPNRESELDDLLKNKGYKALLVGMWDMIDENLKENHHDHLDGPSDSKGEGSSKPAIQSQQNKPDHTGSFWHNMFSPHH